LRREKYHRRKQENQEGDHIKKIWKKKLKKKDLRGRKIR
jgi:hypothetical protein